MSGLSVLGYFSPFSPSYGEGIEGEKNIPVDIGANVLTL